MRTISRTLKVLDSVSRADATGRPGGLRGRNTGLQVADGQGCGRVPRVDVESGLGLSKTHLLQGHLHWTLSIGHNLSDFQAEDGSAQKHQDLLRTAEKTLRAEGMSESLFFFSFKEAYISWSFSC